MLGTRKLHTVLVENYQLDKETGIACKFKFILYSAPCSPAMAKALAENLRRVNKSYRIQEDDGKGKVVEEWLRNGFVPDEERTGE